MKKLSNITESVWADIHRRSNGSQERKEDDIDLLDAQGFVEYLRDIYKNVNTDFYIFKDLNDVITVPMFETELGTKSTWFIKYVCTDNSVLIWNHFLNEDDKLFDKLIKEYKVTKYLIKSEFINNFLITPKTGKSSNKFFIEIIDFLLENTSIFFHRIIVKKDNMNESVWADIHKRSNGKQERKEDIIKTNVAELKPVDIGVSVLWSDKDLEIDGEIFLEINQIQGFKKDGWRLPVQKEADELMTDAIWSSTRDPHTIKRYYEIGITHIADAITKKDTSEENTIYFTCEFGKEAEYWLDDLGSHTPPKYWATFRFKHDGSFFPHSAYSMTKIDGGKCRIRLVKDK